MLEFGTAVARGARRLLHDDTGQELIEYAILTGFIAAGSVALFAALAGTMYTAYAGPTGWNESAQAAWEPCDPGVLPPCP